jgi:hypothetical protein
MIRLSSRKLNSGNSNAIMGSEIAVMGHLRGIPDGRSSRAIELVKTLGERSGVVSGIRSPQRKLAVSPLTSGTASALPMNGFLPFLSVLRPQLT